jgi:hypothetical protein
MIRLVLGFSSFLLKMLLLIAASVAAASVEYFFRTDETTNQYLGNLPLLQDFFQYFAGPFIIGNIAALFWSFRNFGTYSRTVLVIILGFLAIEFLMDSLEYFISNIFGIDFDKSSEKYLESLSLLQGIVWTILAAMLYLSVFCLNFSAILKTMGMRGRWFQLTAFTILAVTILFIHEGSYQLILDGTQVPFDSMPAAEREFLMFWVLFQKYIIILFINYVFSKTARARKQVIPFHSAVMQN